VNLPRTAFEDLLRRLREHKTELPVYDGKADLPLKTDGDRAFFIRHIAALANNSEPSYLIIGVENKTWKPIGLAENSPLRDSDGTQQQMNHILKDKLDPNISIHYCTYQVADDVLYGLVTVEGTRAPYIVAIPNRRYGGHRTGGDSDYIYQGAIYYRHGANSVIADRQSTVLEIIRKAHPQPDKFLEDCDYTNPESEDFGRHQLSERLVEPRLKVEEPLPDWLKAQSWVSFVLCPVNGGCEIDTVALKDKLRPNRQRLGQGPEWYRWLPYSFHDMLSNPQATSQEFLGMDPQSSNEISRFVRIRLSGHIEVGCTSPLFFQGRDDRRYFQFVYLIGYLWQIVYQSQAIYRDAGFYGEITALVNLVGTKETCLTDFAPGWISPPYTTYQDYKPNIQTLQRLLLAPASDGEIKAVVHKIAGDLGAYYGQDSPRCFDCRTGEFPHKDYKGRR
jgi:hypothetical protein